MPSKQTNLRQASLTISTDLIASGNLSDIMDAVNDRLRQIEQLHAASAGHLGPVGVAQQTAVEPGTGLIAPGITLQNNRVAGVADAQQLTDAVNLGQLKQAIASIPSAEDQIANVGGDITSIPPASVGGGAIGCESARITPAGTYATSLSAGKCVVQGNYRYYVGMSGSHVVLLVLYYDTFAATFTLVKTVTTGLANSTTYPAIAIEGRYLYIAVTLATPKLLIYDIIDPGNPAELTSGGFTLPNAPIDIYAQGRLLHVSATNYYIYDISAPAHPILLSTTNAPGGDSFLGVFAWGQYAYLAVNLLNSTKIYLISDPTAPSLKSTTAAAQSGGREYLWTNGFYAIGVGIHQ